jgi:hypothetical protein
LRFGPSDPAVGIEAAKTAFEAALDEVLSADVAPADASGDDVGGSRAGRPPEAVSAR